MPRRLAVVVLVLLAATGTAAAEGFYLRGGPGGSETRGTLSRFYRGGAAARGVVGHNFGGIAVELGFAAGDLTGAGPFAGRIYSHASFGVHLMKVVPLVGPLSLFGRAGVVRSSVSAIWSEDSRGDGYRGRGLDLGGGLVVAGRMPWIGLLHPALLLIPALRGGPRVSVGGWIDIGREHVVLHRPRATSLGGALDTVTIGLSLGGDF